MKKKRNYPALTRVVVAPATDIIVKSDLPVQVTSVTESLQIPSTVSREYVAGIEAWERVKPEAMYEIARIEAWAVAVLRALHLPTTWQHALGRTDSMPGTLAWYAANALAACNSTREFVAEGKARDAAITATDATMKFHDALLVELREPVGRGVNEIRAGKKAAEKGAPELKRKEGAETLDAIKAELHRQKWKADTRNISKRLSVTLGLHVETVRKRLRELKHSARSRTL